MPELSILVVEDDDAVGRMLGHALRGFGFRVQLASSGLQAIDLYRREAIDVVLMDVQMPDMDGPETMAALKTIDPAVVCCFMSAHPGRYEGEDFVRMGSAGIIQKPFALEALRQFLVRAHASAAPSVGAKPGTCPADRRAFPRLAALPGVKIACFVKNFDYAQDLAMRLLDQSKAGLRVLLRGPVPVGEEIFVTLDGPAPIQPMMCAGRVVWSDKSRDAGYSTGIMLDRGVAYSDGRRVS